MTARSVQELPTPALVVEKADLESNLALMSARLPGDRLRPHVKAHKCTAIARLQDAEGHHGFTCATPREVLGMAAAGLGADLLLANETVDPERLRAMAALDPVVTVAVDSPETVAAAAAAGIRVVVIDVNVGLPRCGVAPDAAGALADLARSQGLQVRGVMGYEGHVQPLPDRDLRQSLTDDAMALLAAAAKDVGTDFISAGGTGNHDLNTVATEIQAGSYALMDTQYAGTVGGEGGFRNALSVLATVVSVNAAGGFAVADLGLKSLGMDHGNPSAAAGPVWFCSDEHTTFAPSEPVAVGTKLRFLPAHVDPTIAYHEAIWLVDGEEVVERWEVDLRGW
jgi:D-serine deaminase-like pyridoxal phosphate-dependent protein